MGFVYYVIVVFYSFMFLIITLIIIGFCDLGVLGYGDGGF